MAAQVVEIYGIQPVLQVLQHTPEQVLALFCVAQSESSSARQVILQQAADLSLPVQTIRKQKLDTLSQGGVHQGVMARIRVNNMFGVQELKKQLTEALNQDGVPVFLLLEDLTDPHNLGACLRTAEAAKAAGVVVSRRHAAPITAVVRKAACGAAERVKFYQIGSFSALLKKANDLDYQTVAMVAQATAPSIYEVNFKQPSLLVMGAEGPGLKAKTIEACSVKATIPMRDEIGSLNVSVATGVALFEARRQQAC